MVTTNANPNATLLEQIWTLCAVILTISSLVNGSFTALRGFEAWRANKDKWRGAVAKLFWQKMALAIHFLSKGIFFTVIGLMSMDVPSNSNPQSMPLQVVFGVGLISLLLASTAYQIALLVMRPFIDADLEREIIYDAKKTVAEYKASGNGGNYNAD